MTTKEAVLLDTNHLSDLARDPSAPASTEVIRRLHRGDGVLAIGLFNLLELADPAFKDLPEVFALLRDVPTVLANPYENVEDEEFALAVAKANGLTRRPPRVFAKDTSEWGYHVGPVGGGPVDMIEAFRQLPGSREEILAKATWGAESSMMKDSAALIREPELPLTLALQRHLDMQRLRFPGYGNGLTASQVIERVGGNAAFPGYQVQESLLAQRMKDPGQKSTKNDVFDEFIAFYAPYAAATALDRRTFHRARMAKLSSVPRMTRDLSQVPAILDRVIAGELSTVQSAW